MPPNTTPTSNASRIMPRRTPATSRRITAPVGAPAAAPLDAVKAAPKPPPDPAWVMPLRAALGALRDVEQRHRHAQDRLLVVRREVADARAALAREEAAGPIDGNGRSVDVTVAAGDRLNAAEVEAARMSRITAALGEQAETARAALGPLIEVGRVGSIEWLDTELVAIDREYRAAADATMSIIARFVAVADQAGALHLTEAAIRLRLVRSLLDSGEGVMEIGSMLGMTPPVASPTSEQAADLRRLLDTARTAAAGSTSQHKEAA